MPPGVGFSKKGLFGFRMRNKILRRSEKIETRSKKHDFSDRNSAVYLIQWVSTLSHLPFPEYIIYMLYIIRTSSSRQRRIALLGLGS